MFIITSSKNTHTHTKEKPCDQALVTSDHPLIFNWETSSGAVEHILLVGTASTSSSLTVTLFKVEEELPQSPLSVDR